METDSEFVDDPELGSIGVKTWEDEGVERPENSGWSTVFEVSTSGVGTTTGVGGVGTTAGVGGVGTTAGVGGVGMTTGTGGTGVVTGVVTDAEGNSHNPDVLLPVYPEGQSDATRLGSLVLMYGFSPTKFPGGSYLHTNKSSKGKPKVAKGHSEYPQPIFVEVAQTL